MKNILNSDSLLLAADRFFGPRFIPFYAWFVCILGALFYCYEYYLRVSPSVMSSELMSFFHLDGFGFGNLTAYYYYAYTPMQFCVGLLMDRVAPRRLLTLACLCCVAGVFLFSSTHVLMIAALGRFLIGFGSAFAFVGTLKIASIWLPPERFAFVAGSITTLGMIGALVGEMSLSALVSHLGWRETMVCAGIVGFLVMALLWLFIRDRSFGEHRTYTDTHTAALTFRPLFKSFFVALCTKQIWIAGIIGCFLYLPLSALAELWGVPYLSQVYHISTTTAATLCSMIFLGWAVGGPIAGFVSDHLTVRRAPLIIGALVSCILFIIILYTSHLPLGLLGFLLFLFGVFNSVESITFAIGKEAAPKEIAGTAVALINTLVMVGGVIFQPLIGELLDIHAHTTLGHIAPIYSVADYRFALLVIPVGLIVAFVLSFYLKEKLHTIERV